jgi:hypothetical protein
MQVPRKVYLWALYRKQWVNIEELPTYFSGHAPVGNNVGAGLSFISDKVGPVTEQNVFGDFSYTFKIKWDQSTCLGISWRVVSSSWFKRHSISSCQILQKEFWEDINDALNLDWCVLLYRKLCSFSIRI